MNILLLFPDQWRPDWLGFLGKVPVRTPHLDSLARRGISFSHAVCPSPVCSPSRACLSLGCEYDACPVPDVDYDLPEQSDTFYKRLRSSGYHVMGCGKFDLAKAASDWTRDGRHPRPGMISRLEDWGFSDGIDNAGKIDGVEEYQKGNACPYMDFLEQHNLAQVHVADFCARRQSPEPSSFTNTFPTPLPDDFYGDNYIGRNALHLLRNAPRNKPWFLQVNFNGPHDPLDVTASMQEKWRDIDFPLPIGGPGSLPENIHQEIRRNYAAMLENIDSWIGRFIEELRQMGQLDDTLIVFSSDHGEMLGDHGCWRKVVPYTPSVGVPLVIAGPQVLEGRTISAPVTLIDLARTFLEAANAGRTTLGTSKSLWPVLRGEAEGNRDFVLSGLRGWRMVSDGRYKWISGYRPRPGVPQKSLREEGPVPDLLFDEQNDPHEMNDIAPENPGICSHLREIFESSRSSALAS